MVEAGVSMGQIATGHATTICCLHENTYESAKSLDIRKIKC